MNGRPRNCHHVRLSNRISATNEVTALVLPGYLENIWPGMASSSATAQRATRRDRPCDACRKRKNRCIKVSDEPDTCILCQTRSSKCTFVQSPPPKKRKRLDDEGSSPNEAKPRSPADAMHSIISPRAPLDYENLPSSSLLRQTLGHQNLQSNEYIGSTTEQDLCLIGLSSFSDKDVSETPSGSTLRRMNQDTHFLLRNNTDSENDGQMDYLDMVEAIVAPHGQALIDLYFRIVHPSYPILHKKVFLEKYGRSYRELTPTCLAAVYILALNWWSYSPNLVRFTKPNAQELDTLFPKMLADVSQRPKASDIQGGLVYLQRPEGSSWVMIGHLIAMGQNLGLHLDCSDWRIPEWERALRKRLAWALFLQDKWGSLVHGRPPYIVLDNWDVKPVERRDFPETAKDDDDEEGSSEVEKGMEIFIHLISLTEILSDILSTFFTLKAQRNRCNTAETLDKAKPLQIRLKSWYSNLPPSCSMEETKTRKLSSAGHLHLAYFATEVTLHRAILRSLDVGLTDDRLKLVTRNAAKMRFTSAVEFVKRLRPEHLQSFWFFASKINLAIIGAFGGILWATSETKEECEFYRSQLAEYRWTLRVSSNAAEFMKFTVGMLDNSPVFMADADLKISGNWKQSHIGERDPPRSEIDGQNQAPEAISNAASAFDFNGLSGNEYWLDYTASGIASQGGLPWENPGGSMTTPSADWVYSHDNGFPSTS